MSEEKYFASQEKDEVERKRMALLGAAYDPATVRQLEALGVSEGWKCLEVGAGRGSIAQWIANTVGLKGKVVATDVNVRFLRDLDLPNLEVREHNILTDPIEVGSYDLVHARMVLMHLPEPEKAVKRMSDALRPGGWLFIEDSDFGSCLSMNMTDSRLDALVAMLRSMNSFYEEKGVYHPYFGRNEPRFLEQLGFVDIGHQGWVQAFHGGEPLAEYNCMAFQYLKYRLLSAGLSTQQEVDDVERYLSDPSITFIDQTVFGAWGRKPE